MKLTEIEEYFKESLYEMSYYRSHKTGFTDGATLWVRTEPLEHGHVKYRIKITHKQRGSAVFALWGDEVQQIEGDWKITGRDLKYIQDFFDGRTVEKVRKHIDAEMDSDDLGAVLKSRKKRLLG